MFFKKVECLVSTYKNGSLRDKLSKKQCIYKGVYFIHKLFHILTKKKKKLNNNNNILLVYKGVLLMYLLKYVTTALHVTVASW